MTQRPLILDNGTIRELSDLELLQLQRITSATGAMQIPEGNDDQRPAEGLRINNKTSTDIFVEFFKRAAAPAWEALASRPWVKSITDALEMRVTSLEDRKQLTSTGPAPCLAVRAMVVFTGSTPPVIQKAVGVTGVTRLAAGHWRVHLEHAAPDAFYGIAHGSPGDARWLSTDPASKTTTSFEVSCSNAAPQRYDSPVSVSVIY